MRGFTVNLAVSVFAPFSILLAQQPPLEYGARVRVTAPDLALEKATGIYQTLFDGVMEIAPDGWPDVWRVEIASVTRIDVHRGRKSNSVNGAIIGFVPAAIVGVCFHASNTGDEGFWPAIAVVSGVAFGAAGALIGATIGSYIKSDRWEEVPLDQLRVSFAPQRDGRLALGVSVAF